MGEQKNLEAHTIEYDSATQKELPIDRHNNLAESHSHHGKRKTWI